MCLRLRPEIPLCDVQEEVTPDVCGLVGLDTGEDLAVLRTMAGRFVEAARWADEAVGHLERRDRFNFLALAHATVTVVANELGDTERAESAIALCRAAQEGRKPHETEWFWFGHAEAAAQAAAGDPPAAQRTLLETAERIDGLPIFAARLSYEALRRGARAAPVAEPGMAANGLTPREAQLVELASRGLTNAEIAERLVLSVRTVETHLYRAMQKLGISDRRDL
jgi:DNA-binding CsgD family transcriptional regulator